MKALFSIAALLLALAITGMLVKKQLHSVAPVAPAANASGTAPATPANQVQQVGQQVQSLMQQARPSAPEQ